MRVGIVLHPFGNSAKGLEQYIFESTRSLIEASDNTTAFTVFVKGNPDTSGLPEGITIVHIPSVFYWHLYLLKHYASCDVFVFFTEASPIFLWRKSIIVFFDAAYYYFGETSILSRIQRSFLVLWRSWMMRFSRHVVTISEASKKDLVEIFSVPKNQVSVIHPGFKALQTETIHTVDTNREQYFMYIGPVKERKNVLRIVGAFEIFKTDTGISHKLFLVGRKSKGVYEEKVDARIQHSVYKDEIIYKTNVSDADLGEVYRNATALVFPSLLEGFGLPVLEALSCNCMVITSSTTSTKEALGEVGILVDPKNEREIATAMILIARGEYDKTLFAQNAKKHAQSFTWEKSGNEWNSVLKKSAD
jgi:glycosyltransferase involved in cell wall biosynthesis